MIIEIVGDDYYANSNPHVEIADLGQLEALYKDWKEVPNKSRWHWSFAEWLVERGLATWPEDSKFDSFEESYQ